MTTTDDTPETLGLWDFEPADGGPPRFELAWPALARSVAGRDPERYRLGSVDNQEELLARRTAWEAEQRDDRAFRLYRPLPTGERP